MVQWLNKKVFCFLFFSFLSNSLCIGQVGMEAPVYKDYKDQDQYEKFYKRRKLIAAWQIHELKQGALVVRLKTNKLLIDALVKSGNTEMANKKTLEALAINLNISRAYRNFYSFSKVYFIYSNYSDSLLNGIRSNIFLDSNLLIDPKIEMVEKFYLMAEYDDVYNSSIGFVPEDTARYISESGNITTPEAPIVLKNKYGHQLKQPFPYKYYFTPIGRIFLNRVYEEKIMILGKKTTFYPIGNKSNNTTRRLVIPEDLTYSHISMLVRGLNDNLTEFYRNNRKLTAEELQAIKPFLY